MDEEDGRYETGEYKAPGIFMIFLWRRSFNLIFGPIIGVLMGIQKIKSDQIRTPYLGQKMG